MDRTSFEAALSDLSKLMGEAGHSEADYQKWFEQHPLVFDCVPYKRVIPHPELTDAGKVMFIPDFIAQRLDGLWEIFEIKRPDTEVIRDVVRRQTFYATLERYLRQCRDYAGYFDDAAHRNEFSDRYGIEVEADPPSVLVAGRSAGLDRFAVHRLLMDRGGKVALKTYDDISVQLDHFRIKQFGQYENLAGLSMHLIIEVHQMPDASPNFLVDFGLRPDCDRISVYVDSEQRVCLEVFEHGGKKREIVTDRGTLPCDQPAYVVVEVGVGDRESTLTVEVNGQNSALFQLNGIELDLTSLQNSVLGSDLNGKAGSEFDLAERVDYSRTLEFHERSQLKEYFLSRHGAGLLTTIHLSGHQFLYSQNHPNFT
jgi:hypothetical protein